MRKPSDWRGDNPEGSNTVGHWAVDQITGDVWDSAARALYASPALSKAQERLRKRVGMAASEYMRSRKNASWCRADQNPLTIEMGRPAWWALKKKLASNEEHRQALNPGVLLSEYGTP